MTNTKLLELWGETLLETARVSKGPQAFFDIFQNGYASKSEKTGPSYKRFAELCKDSFGKEGIETFNSVMQDFYRNVGVVPRAQYNALKADYDQLLDRVRAMEKTLDGLKSRLESGGSAPIDLMDQWMDMAKKYASINQQFFAEFGKFFAANSRDDDQE